jgi:hypothetical protein
MGLESTTFQARDRPAGLRKVTGLTEDDAQHLVDTLEATYAVKSVSLSLVLLRSAMSHAASRGQIPRLVAETFCACAQLVSLTA